MLFQLFFSNPKRTGKKWIFNAKKIKIRWEQVASLIKWLELLFQMYIWIIQALPKGFERLATGSPAENLELPPFCIFFLSRNFSFSHVFKNYFCRMERYPGVPSWTIPKAYMRMRWPKSILVVVALVSRLYSGQNRTKCKKFTRKCKKSKKWRCIILKIHVPTWYKLYNKWVSVTYTSLMK